MRDAYIRTGGSKVIRFLIAAGLGAALVYFLDRDKGKERREKFAEQFSDMTRRGTEKLDEAAKYTTNKAEEMADRTAQLEVNGNTPDFTDAQSLSNTTQAYT
jgi:hypothetical protein